MSLRPKPKQSAGGSNDRAIEALIDKGGSVATEPREQTRLKTLQLRLPPSLIQQVDTSLEKRKIPPSRHTWFLEAILEKLERENPR